MKKLSIWVLASVMVLASSSWPGAQEKLASSPTKGQGTGPLRLTAKGLKASASEPSLEAAILAAAEQLKKDGSSPEEVKVTIRRWLRINGRGA